MPAPQLTTGRLLLRHWREADRQPWAQLNADPLVRRYFPGPLSRPEADALLDQLSQGLRSGPFGMWAVDVVDPGPDEPGRGFVGAAGLWQVTFAAHFTPAVDVAWRLLRSAWGTAMRPRPPVPPCRTASTSWA